MLSTMLVGPEFYVAGIIFHELAHQIVDLRDLYGFASGSLALGGPTITNDERFFQPNAFEKLHWELMTFAVFYLILQALIRGRKLAKLGKEG